MPHLLSTTSPFYRGPSAVEMENVDKAIATVTGLQVGTYHFRLTVRDQQGLSSTSTLTVAVKQGKWTWGQDLNLPCLPVSLVPSLVGVCS